MNSCAVWAMRAPSNGITTSSSTPSAAIRSALISSDVSSFGALSGATTVRGFVERDVSSDIGRLFNAEVYTPNLCVGIQNVAAQCRVLDADAAVGDQHE